MMHDTVGQRWYHKNTINYQNLFTEPYATRAMYVLLGAGGVFRLGWHRWGTALLMVQSGSRALAPEEEPEEDDGSRVFRVAVTRSDDTR